MSPRVPSLRPLPGPISPRTAAARWARRGGAALAALGAVALGTVLGLVLTAAAIRSDAIGTVRAGPWRLFTDVGTPGINPYLRARQARVGNVPLAAAQGLTATAREDSAGGALDGRCRYRVSGPVPAAQFWTLEATDLAGQPFSNAAARQAFTSAEVLRDAAGRVAVLLSPGAEPGNWLPLPGAGRFLLVLRLYDTGLTSGGVAGARDAAWPAIEALGCG